MKSFYLSISFAFSACLSPLCSGQDLPFESGSTGADGALSFARPIPREISPHSAAFDESRQNLVILLSEIPFRAGGAWIWNDLGWSRPISTAIQPTWSFGDTMVYETAFDRILLHKFGDQTTWTWDGSDWTQLNPANSPPQGTGVMVYDAERGEVLAFVGHYTDPSTWTWDGTDWTEKQGANSPNVSASAGMMAYDEIRKEVVLYGGDLRNRSSDQTYTWDGTVWTERIVATNPGRRSSHNMAFDRVAGETILFGGGPQNTWAWDGTIWIKRADTNPAGGIRNRSTMTWDSRMQRVVRVGGMDNGNPSRAINETSSWNRDQSRWEIEASPERTFDMTSRPDGIWNFTTIDIDSLVTVNFKRNAANTPVVWLASEEVRIEGDLNLNGEAGGGVVNIVDIKDGGAGGPGGGDGGRGGENFDTSGSFRGEPGFGPGGGAGGVNADQNGADAVHADLYGDPYLRYAFGGSGGGGGSSDQNFDGGGGGGGGGSIIIASSRDLILNGEISVRGGSGHTSNQAGRGGRGSGGTVRLSADRVLGNGDIETGGGNTSPSRGWIRLEGYVRTLASSGQFSPFPTASLPLETQDFANRPMLRVTTVAGVAVADPPLGDFSAPDVVFTEAGTVAIVATSTGLTDGTEIDLRVSINGEIFTAPSQPLAGGEATFNLTVPAGIGTIQVFTKNP